MIGIASDFAASVVGHIVDGCRVAPPEVQADRLRICRSNECGQSVDDGRGCSACHCGTNAAMSFVGLDMARKRSWASSRCALDPPRWEAV